MNGSAVGWTVSILVLLLVALAVGLVGCPQYAVYNQRLQGQALLAHAQSAKEVAVAEAKAKMESASLLAEAEVARAKGVAAANKIIGDSLKDNTAYLDYLWIHEVAGQGNNREIIYVPTGQGSVLPQFLEAGRVGIGRPPNQR